MRQKKKIIREHHIEVETKKGTYERATETVSHIPNEPSYVKLYIQDIMLFCGLKSRSADIVFMLLRRLDFDGIITLTRRWKENASRELGIKPQTFDNYLQEIKKKNIIKPIGRSEFMMNPNLFAKGSWSDIRRMREKYLNVAITYTNGKRIIKSSFDDTPLIHENDLDIFE